MAHFYTVLGLSGGVLDELRQRREEREAMFDMETKSVTDIQRCHRGSVVRARITQMTVAGGQIQRIFRGFTGRNRARACRAEAQRDDRMGFFHYQASIIQKWFRGFYSRRYYHDFYARKQYIQEVSRKSEQLRQRLHEHRQKLLEYDEQQRQNNAREEFEQVTENLHHLLSTKCQPGIYNSPYLQGNVPTAFGVPVEAHLRHGMKTYLKRSMSHRGVATPGSSSAGTGPGTASGSRASLQSRPAGSAGSTIRPRSRISVQAQSKYGEQQEMQRMEAKYSRLKRLSPKPFSAGSRTRYQSLGPGISQGTPYEELWKVARSSRDPAVEDKSQRVSDKPFVSAMKKGGRDFDDYADEMWYKQVHQLEQQQLTRAMSRGGTR